MTKSKFKFKKILPYVKNKYVISIVAFIVWLAFFDRNDFYSQYSYRKKLQKIKQDESYFVEEIKKSKSDLHDLTTNPKNLEKFAREKYLMKKDNEEIFVLVTEDQKTK